MSKPFQTRQRNIWAPYQLRPQTGASGAQTERPSTGAAQSRPSTTGRVNCLIPLVKMAASLDSNRPAPADAREAVAGPLCGSSKLPEQVYASRVKRERRLGFGGSSLTERLKETEKPKRKSDFWLTPTGASMHAGRWGGGGSIGPQPEVARSSESVSRVCSRIMSLTRSRPSHLTRA